MTAGIEFLEFESRETASAAAADLLSDLLRSALEQKPKNKVSLVLSGGSTPGLCFDLLSSETLDWSRVTVVPSDERWVSPDHPDSNERLIRSRLLQGQASKGKVLSFFRAGVDAIQAPSLIQQDLAELPHPYSASLLGMGEDGHFASLFPDFSDLHLALDPQGKLRCLAVQTAGSPHTRISLTLSEILDSEHIVLLIYGDNKRQVFEAAQAGDGRYPVESLLTLAKSSLSVIWAP